MNGDGSYTSDYLQLSQTTSLLLDKVDTGSMFTSFTYFIIFIPGSSAGKVSPKSSSVMIPNSPSSISSI